MQNSYAATVCEPPVSSFNAPQVEELQEMHLSQAEAAAERINLPSPSSIRAKFKPSSDQFG